MCCFCNWLGVFEDPRSAFVFWEVPCASATPEISLLIELYSTFWLIPFSGGRDYHSPHFILQLPAQPRFSAGIFPFIGETKIVLQVFSGSPSSMWNAEDFLHANYDLPFSPLLSLPVCIPEAMFCFCFQSPSLKLQALEADLGPLAPPLDPQAQDNLPAQQQPLSTEDQSLYLTNKLLLHPASSPPAQAQQTVDSSQPGKTLAMKCWYTDHIKVSELPMLNIYLGQRRK